MFKRPSLILLCSIASLAFAGTSNAVVIWFSGVNIPLPADFTGVYVDFETAATTTVPDAAAEAHFNLGGFVVSNNANGSPTPSWQPVRIASDNATLANLSFGELIGPAGPYTAGIADSASHLGSSWTVGVPGYLGFSFEHSSLGTRYGWALATFDPFGGGTISTYVWQDNGNPIPAGIPEPTAPLLSLLGAGLLLLRRRR